MRCLSATQKYETEKAFNMELLDRASQAQVLTGSAGPDCTPTHAVWRHCAVHADSMAVPRSLPWHCGCILTVHAQDEARRKTEEAKVRTRMDNTSIDTFAEEEKGKDSRLQSLEAQNMQAW